MCRHFLSFFLPSVFTFSAFSGAVTLGYKGRERDEGQGRGFHHSACSLVSDEAQRYLPKLIGIGSDLAARR